MFAWQPSRGRNLGPVDSQLVVVFCLYDRRCDPASLHLARDPLSRRPDAEPTFQVPAAVQVMRVVKDLLVTQTAGITICSTIHSPTPFCFRLFDRMTILLRGQVVYFGQRGASRVLPLSDNLRFAGYASLPAVAPDRVTEGTKDDAHHRAGRDTGVCVDSHADICASPCPTTMPLVLSFMHPAGRLFKHCVCWLDPRVRQAAADTLISRCAGNEALEYFKDNNPGAEPMAEGSNEAEWIVDLTTHADRDDMCGAPVCRSCFDRQCRSLVAACGLTATLRQAADRIGPGSHLTRACPHGST